MPDAAITPGKDDAPSFAPKAPERLLDDPALPEMPVALGVGTSLALHGFFLLALLAFVANGPPLPPAEQGIAVDILSPAQFDALTAPPEGATRPTLPAESPPAPVIVRPTRMLSAGALADPRSREARALLPTLDDTERMVQLCDLEAMEQVHAWRDSFHPDRVVAYAMHDLAIAGETVEAGGAAFRSDDAWYNLKFTCRLAPDHTTVAAFEFMVGDPVPRNQWQARNLPSDSGTQSD